MCPEIIIQPEKSEFEKGGGLSSKHGTLVPTVQGITRGTGLNNPDTAAKMPLHCTQEQ